MYDIFTCCILYFFAIISPGPSLLTIINASLNLGKKQAIATAYGVVLAIAIQISFIFAFLDIIKFIRPILIALQYILALFLFTMGVSKLFTRNTEVHVISPKIRIHPFIEGLLVEILNPFALIFFLSVFTPYVLIYTFSFKLICLALFVIIALIIFPFFALVFSSKILRYYILKNLLIVEKVSATLFILFSIKVLLGNITIK